MRDHSESATDFCNAPDRRMGLSLGGAFAEMFKSLNIISITTVFIWVLIAVSAVSLPFLPTDGTRYVSVAWDMWLNHSQWVPLMNGAPYSDKPPLLFWLMELGWYVFGVNDLWPRLISPLASLLALAQLYRIARGLGYPKPIAQLSQLVLLSLPLWSLYSSLVMFDVLLSACVLGAIEPLTRPGAFTFRKAFISGIWLGMAMLTKGPVALMAFVPVLVTAGVWRMEPLGRRGIIGGMLAILMSIAILMTWALSAAWVGGHEFAQSLLWGQTVDRVHGANAAHARPVWWYCSWLPIFAAPWILWAEQWGRLDRSGWKSLLFWWLLPPFLIFSLISGKQVHYMMPLMPALALWIAGQVGKINGLYGEVSTPASSDSSQLSGEAKVRSFDTRRLAIVFLFLAVVSSLIWRGVIPIKATDVVPVHLSVVIIFIFSGVFLWACNRSGLYTRLCAIAAVINISLVLCGQITIANSGGRYDVSPLSHEIATLQQQGLPIAYADGNYQATFQFNGRLQYPLIPLDGKPLSIHQFAIQQPHGWIVGDLQDFSSEILASSEVKKFPYKGRILILVSNSAVIAHLHWISEAHD